MRELLKYTPAVIKNFFLFRHILLQMVIQEIKGRFAGSMGGLLWSLIHPVLMIIVYLFVFICIFKLRVGTTGSAGTSAVYLMSGLFPWIIMAEGLSRGTSSMIENANIIQKTPFPTEILPAKAVIVPIFSYGIAVLLLALYKIIFFGSFEIIFILPLIIVMQTFFTLGIAFLTSAISVFFRDIIQLVHVIISFWIFLTPVFYPINMLPEWAKKAMYFNPLYPFITTYQSLFGEGTSIQLGMILIIGAFIFSKLKYEFADWL
jgi:lipopolysaccharide transport system permease protein